MSDGNGQQSNAGWLEESRRFVRDSLNEGKIHFQEDAERPQRFILPYSSKSSFHRFNIFVFLEQGWIGILAAPEQKVPPKARKAFAELCSRINFITRPARTSVDFTDGEIRVDYWLFCREALPAPRMFLDAIMATVNLFETWADGFLDLIVRHKSPEDIFQVCFAQHYQNPPQEHAPDAPKLPAGLPISNSFSDALNAPLGETPDLNADPKERPDFFSGGHTRDEFEF